MGWYITIQQEMRDDLGLKGNELIVFAFINGYSQEGQGCYFGSLANLQSVCGIASRQTAIDVLKSLISKGLINKTENNLNGIKYISYSICQKIGQGVQKMDRGCPKNGHNNKDIDINNNSLYKENGNRFKKPSLEEIRDYCISRSNNVDPEQFFDFYESKGWVVGKSTMKDWRAAVRTWEKREKEVAPRKRESTQKESVFSHNLKVMDQMFGTNLHEQAYGGEGYGK